jgi:hypothetical protein
VFGPDDAVNGLGRRVPDGAAGKGLLVRLGRALVALGLGLSDDGHLAEVSRGARLDERDVGRKAHAVHVRAGGAVVERVQHKVEPFEEGDSVIGAEMRNGLLSKSEFQ